MKLLGTIFAIVSGIGISFILVLAFFSAISPPQNKEEKEKTDKLMTFYRIAFYILTAILIVGFVLIALA